MSDMSFKQAKELVERMELTELTLKNTVEDIEKSTNKFNNSLKQQSYIFEMIPKQESKLVWMKVLIALNFGFILGLIAAKYLL